MPGRARRTLHVAELPARYRVRPPVVVDCSVLAAAVFIEPDCDLAAPLVTFDARLAKAAAKHLGSLT